MRDMRIGWFLTVAVLAGLLTASFAMAQKNDQAEMLMQAANHKQLMEGQLEEAIQLYKNILANYSGNRAVAAKALVQMGQCYEKLGRAEARKAYERVVREYADQPEAAEARMRLAALTLPVKPAISAGVVVRQVWTTGPDVGLDGSPSPDGRYLCYVDWTTGDLALRDLVSGESRRVTNKGPWSKAVEFAEHFCRFSSDGKQLAYMWFKDVNCELRIIGLDGSAPRVVYRNEQQDVCWAYDWSPDGKYIAAGIVKTDKGKPEKTGQIALISVADGAVRVLKSLPIERPPQKMSFSPDGRFLAYDLPSSQDAQKHDIFALDVDDGREIPVVVHPADDRLLGWTPSGDGILFASDRAGTTGAWLAPVKDGKPQGRPELVRQDIGQSILPLGPTRGGSYYYATRSSEKEVYTATLDLTKGALVDSPTPASQRILGSNGGPE